ncbi:unnamed protein product, partial [Cyprideis torosa]
MDSKTVFTFLSLQPPSSVLSYPLSPSPTPEDVRPPSRNVDVSSFPLQLPPTVSGPDLFLPEANPLDARFVLPILATIGGITVYCYIVCLLCLLISF